MSDCMHFPDTVEEFMEQYKMTDTKQVYSNGTKYVPIFRMEQWFEHEKAQLSKESTISDLISRQAAIDAVAEGLKRTFIEYKDVAEKLLNEVPSAQPERTCVNCGRTANNGGWYADGKTRCPIEEHYALPKDGFCHLWEKRNITDDDYPERRTDE